MPMGPEELRSRTKTFAIRIVKVYKALPHGADAQVLGKQLLRCGSGGELSCCCLQSAVPGGVDCKDWPGC